MYLCICVCVLVYLCAGLLLLYFCAGLLLLYFCFLLVVRSKDLHLERLKLNLIKVGLHMEHFFIVAGIFSIYLTTNRKFPNWVYISPIGGIKSPYGDK